MPKAPRRPKKLVSKSQLTFLDPTGDVAAPFVCQRRPSVRRPALDPDALPENGERTPGKCLECGGRVRNKNRLRHVQCEKAIPMDPFKAPAQGVTYPDATFCVPCSRLDNGFIPAKVCRTCNGPMGPVPDELKPKGKTPFVPTRTRRR